MIGQFRIQSKYVKKAGKILQYLGIYLVSFVMLSFGIAKFMGTQFVVWNYAQYTPLIELPPFWHAWSFFGRSYAYNFFIGLSEVTVAVLIIFNRTRLAGLLLAAGIYTNIIIMDVEFEVDQALLHASIEFITVLLLLIPYLPDLKRFFWDMGGKWSQGNRQNRRTSMFPIVYLFLASVLVVLFTKINVTKDELNGAYKISGVMLDQERLSVGQGKFTKDPMMFFEFGNTCIFTLNDSTYFGKYMTREDSLDIQLKNSFSNIKSIKGGFGQGWQAALRFNR